MDRIIEDRTTKQETVGLQEALDKANALITSAVDAGEQVSPSTIVEELYYDKVSLDLTSYVVSRLIEGVSYPYIRSDATFKYALAQITQLPTRLIIALHQNDSLLFSPLLLREVNPSTGTAFAAATDYVQAWLDSRYGEEDEEGNVTSNLAAVEARLAAEAKTRASLAAQDDAVRGVDSGSGDVEVLVDDDGNEIAPLDTLGGMSNVESRIRGALNRYAIVGPDADLIINFLRGEDIVLRTENPPDADREVTTMNDLTAMSDNDRYQVSAPEVVYSDVSYVHEGEPISFHDYPLSEAFPLVQEGGKYRVYEEAREPLALLAASRSSALLSGGDKTLRGQYWEAKDAEYSGVSYDPIRSEFTFLGGIVPDTLPPFLLLAPQYGGSTVGANVGTATYVPIERQTNVTVEWSIYHATIDMRLFLYAIMTDDTLRRAIGLQESVAPYFLKGQQSFTFLWWDEEYTFTISRQVSGGDLVRPMRYPLDHYDPSRNELTDAPIAIAQGTPYITMSMANVSTPELALTVASAITRYLYVYITQVQPRVQARYMEVFPPRSLGIREPVPRGRPKGDDDDTVVLGEDDDDAPKKRQKGMPMRTVVIQLTGFELETVPVAIGGTSGRLQVFKQVAPHIFTNGYARVCPSANQPTLLQGEQLEEWKQSGKEYIRYPLPGEGREGDPLLYFGCDDPSAKHIGVKRDRASHGLSRELYPLKPCCFSKAQITNTSSLTYRSGYRFPPPDDGGDDVAPPPEPVAVPTTSDAADQARRAPIVAPINTVVIYETSKRLDPGRVGKLPGMVPKLLALYGFSDDRRNILRRGVLTGINSAIHCVMGAVLGVDTIYAPGARSQDDLEDAANLWREYVASTDSTDAQGILATLYEALPEMRYVRMQPPAVIRASMAQEYYDASDEDIRKALLDESASFDTYWLYRGLESTFDVNIFVFTREEDETTIEIPRNKPVHLRERRNDMPTILLFKHKRHDEDYADYNLIIEQKHGHKTNRGTRAALLPPADPSSSSQLVGSGGSSGSSRSRSRTTPRQDDHQSEPPRYVIPGGSPLVAAMFDLFYSYYRTYYVAQDATWVDYFHDQAVSPDAILRGMDMMPLAQYIDTFGKNRGYLIVLPDGTRSSFITPPRQPVRVYITNRMYPTPIPSIRSAGFAIEREDPPHGVWVSLRLPPEGVKTAYAKNERGEYIEIPVQPMTATLEAYFPIAQKPTTRRSTSRPPTIRSSAPTYGAPGALPAHNPLAPPPTTGGYSAFVEQEYEVNVLLSALTMVYTVHQRNALGRTGVPYDRLREDAIFRKQTPIKVDQAAPPYDLHDLDLTSVRRAYEEEGLQRVMEALEDDTHHTLVNKGAFVVRSEEERLNLNYYVERYLLRLPLKFFTTPYVAESLQHAHARDVLLESRQLLERWAKGTVTASKVVTRPKDMSPNITLPYIWNDPIAGMMMVQNVQDGDERRALSVAMTFARERVNLGYHAPPTTLGTTSTYSSMPDTLPPDAYNLYVASDTTGSLELRSASDSDYHLLVFPTGEFAALLPL